MPFSGRAVFFVKGKMLDNLEANDLDHRMHYDVYRIDHNAKRLEYAGTMTSAEISEIDPDALLGLWVSEPHSDGCWEKIPLLGNDWKVTGPELVA